MRRAVGFVATAWRDAWLALALSSLGPALMFLGEHAPISRDMAEMLMEIGVLWTLCLMAPVTGGLYRSALGQFAAPQGRRFNMGVHGLQWRMAEWRLVGLFTLVFLLAVLFVVPAAGLGAGLAYLIHAQSDTSMQVSLRIGAFAALAILAFFPVVLARIALGVAATVAEDRIRLFQTWPMTKGRFWSVAGPALMFATLYPAALLAVAYVNDLEGGGFGLGVARWPVIDAVAGAILSGLFHGAVMPTLFTGLFAASYVAWRAKPRLEAADETADQAMGLQPAAEAPVSRPLNLHGSETSPETPRRKPVVRVVAVMAEPGLAVADAQADVPAEPLLHAPLQIGAEFIFWPEGGVPEPVKSSIIESSIVHGAQDTEASAPIRQRASTPDFDRRIAQVWPELERLAVNFSAPLADRLKGEAPIGDVEHGPDTPFPAEIECLEHPMLLAPHVDDPPPGHGQSLSSDPNLWREIDSRKLSELFLPNAVQFMMTDTPTASPAAELPADRRVEAGLADALQAFVHQSGLPRPFSFHGHGVVVGVPANDAVLERSSSVESSTQSEVIDP